MAQLQWLIRDMQPRPFCISCIFLFCALHCALILWYKSQMGCHSNFLLSVFYLTSCFVYVLVLFNFIFCAINSFVLLSVSFFFVYSHPFVFCANNYLCIVLLCVNSCFACTCIFSSVLSIRHVFKIKNNMRLYKTRSCNKITT